MKNEGLCTAKDLPYTSGINAKRGVCSKVSQQCKCQKLPVAKIVEVDAKNQELMKALATQPIVMTIAGGNEAWKQYTGEAQRALNGSNRSKIRTSTTVALGVTQPEARQSTDFGGGNVPRAPSGAGVGGVLVEGLFAAAAPARRLL